MVHHNNLATNAALTESKQFRRTSFARPGKPAYCADGPQCRGPQLSGKGEQVKRQLNRPGFDGGSCYWISTSGWSVRFV
ncbi:hypothetical protein GBO22_00745, partial [Mycobacterium avium subsp. hominissuis]|nr:hypothetical protein [Mycobacterium avium subsp. hominissuis]